MKQGKTVDQPTLSQLSQLKSELKRIRYRSRYQRVLWSTFFALVVVAAFAILAATLWFPVLEIYGMSMTPTLSESEIVVSVKSENVDRGQLIAFYFGNKILVKRCIALPGDVVVITDDGLVSVNGEQLDEPYVSELSLGECDLEFPYTVPQERYFLLGDHRETSIDSRSSVIGCVSLDQVVGKVFFRLWPLNRLGMIGGTG